MEIESSYAVFGYMICGVLTFISRVYMHVEKYQDSISS